MQEEEQSANEAMLDEELDDESNVLGVVPKNMGSFTVRVSKRYYDKVPMTRQERLESLEEEKKEVSWLIPMLI